MSFNIGKHKLSNPLILAPMSGITDLPHRKACKEYGAAMTASEMVASAQNLQDSKKSLSRRINISEASPRIVQIVGTDAKIMSEAAQYNEQIGAEIIDINMGCPAKKVCDKASGSALMQYPDLVKDILNNVVNSVSIPVTLKTRTGWNSINKNALDIVKIAEDAGIQAITIHGRTRHQGYTGHAEYETIRQVVQQTNLPIIANGDIHTAEDIRFIKAYTGCQGIMLGRITRGQPWIFDEILQVLKHGKIISPIAYEKKVSTFFEHISAIHHHYGNEQGVRISRKHISWYLISLLGKNKSKAIKQDIFKEATSEGQFKKLLETFAVSSDVSQFLNSTTQGIRIFKDESTYENIKQT